MAPLIFTKKNVDFVDGYVVYPRLCTCIVFRRLEWLDSKFFLRPNSKKKRIFEFYSRKLKIVNFYFSAGRGEFSAEYNYLRLPLLEKNSDLYTEINNPQHHWDGLRKCSQYFSDVHQLLKMTRERKGWVNFELSSIENSNKNILLG